MDVTEDLVTDNDHASTIGGVYGEEELIDLEVNAFSSLNVEPSPSKTYRYSIKHNPPITEIVYREPNSRAAPRKGIEPKPFLAIGEKKPEKVEIIKKSFTSASPITQKRIAASAKSFQEKHRQTSGKYHECNSRGYTRDMSRGQLSDFRGTPNPGTRYTPLPISLPFAAPTRQNTYISQPFKQATAPLDLEDNLEDQRKRAVSPSDKLKQVTLIATMEVGKLISEVNREKSSKGRPRRNRLLKAHLKPLNDVNIAGPRINHCTGINPDKRTYVPSPIKQRKQKHLDELIEKSAAIKNMSTPHSKPRTTATSNYSKTSSKSPTKNGEENRTGSASKRGPTPSPYASDTHLNIEDSPVLEDVINTNTDLPATGNSTNRTSSDFAEASRPPARSVSAVTIRKTSENLVPIIKSANHATRNEKAANSITFLTENDDSIPQTERKTRKAASAGCQPFKEIRFCDDNDKGPNEHGGSSNNGTSSSFVAQRIPSASKSNTDKTTRQASGQSNSKQTNDASNTTQGQGKKPSTRCQSAKTRSDADSSEPRVREVSGGTFITSGFLSLDTMLSEARTELRRSFSLSQLESVSDEESEPDYFLASPKNPMNRTVSFGDNEYYNITAREDGYFSANDDLISEETSCRELAIIEPDKGLNLHLQIGGETADERLMRQAAQGSVTGQYGMLSEYLTRKSHQKDPAHIPPPAKEANFIPISPCQSIDDISDLEYQYGPAPSPDIFEHDISFLECVTTLMSSPREPELAMTDAVPEKPVAVEGQSKPIKSRLLTIEPISDLPPMCFRINAMCTPGHVYYFAYDADMIENRFNTLLQTTGKTKLWAILFGFQLKFSKHDDIDEDVECLPNITYNRYSSVEGCVYKLAERELSFVDSLHGYRSRTQRIVVPVWISNSTDPENVGVAQYCVPAVTYVAKSESIDSSPVNCNTFSLRQCRKGANQLTDNHRQSLENKMLEAF